VVQAFGAAAIGFFSSLPMTYVGGLIIGAGAAIATKEVAEHPNLTWLDGLPTSLPFIVLFVILIVTPRRRLVDRRVFRPRPQETYRAPARAQCIGGAITLIVLVFIPQLVSGSQLGIYTDGLTKVILFLSLGILVRTSGQVSLCQAGFAAVGATAFSHFAHGFGLPWLVALFLAALVVVPVGAIVAIPAIRLSGIFLALATLGFGITLEQMGYPLRVMFGTSGTGSPVPRPQVLGLDGDTAWYYVVLLFVVLVAMLVVLITHTRLGRLLRGMADSPIALTSLGAAVNTTRVLVFCISAFLAGLSGALYGATVHTVTAAQPTFVSFSSFTLLALLCIVLFGEPWYALLAGASLTVIPYYIAQHYPGDKVTSWLNVVFGLSAVLIAVQNGQHAAPWWKRFCDWIGGRRSAEAEADGFVPLEVAAAVSPASSRKVPGTDDRPGIDVQALTVRYGGNTAVRDVSLAAPMGRITGLIGPNGAGKTTIFNTCSGLVHQSTGAIRLHGEDVSRLTPAARAQRGLGRTFQRMELFDSLTVHENVALGREASVAGNRPLRHLITGSSERRQLDEATAAAAEWCGIRHLLTKQAGQLSTGQRRLVELARTLAGEFDVLLLDEPSSGLDGGETERFGAILTRVVSERGVGILLVEHDMALVMGVCDYIYVLDFGAQIFDGTPGEVARSEAVRAAYLGSEEVLDVVREPTEVIV